MTTTTLVLTNAHGLHARPCHAIVSTAREFRSDLRIEFDGREVNGKSILELMTLNAACGAELRIAARGEDAVGLVAALEALFAAKFNEE